MSLPTAAALAIALALFASAALSSAPRGVAPADTARYAAATFSCDQGSTTIDRARVNDDYCDCHDGSDEPGTAACANGRYWCHNRYHSAEHVPSSRVNDGICDCCDGSDEWEGTVACANNCKELGAAARKAAREALDAVRGGVEERGRMAQRAQQALDAKRAELESLKAAVGPQEAAVQAADAALKAVQETETKLREAADQAKKQAEEAEAAKKAAEPQQPQQQEAEAQEGQQEAEAQEGQQQQQAAAKEGEQAPTMEPMPSMDEAKASVGWGLKSKIQGTPDGQEPPKDAEPVPSSPEAAATEEPKAEEPPKEEEKPSPEMEAAQNAVREAREKLDQANSALSGTRGKISDVEKELATDYGSDSCYYELRGKCFGVPADEYTYEVCFYQNANQKSASGGSTLLGNWDKWDGVHMLYSNGLKCWNGPDRSLNVEVLCGAETKALSASEPGRCEYAMRLQTPCACEAAELERRQAVVRQYEAEDSVSD
eukprot:m51a1_g6896 putative glucosidase 2 subunit beta isoform 2 precursor (487) ;mRNA; f:17219-19825